LIALLQRVRWASVTIDNTLVGEIDAGVLAFIAIEPHDNEVNSIGMLDKILGFRMFNDAAAKMNLNLKQIDGGLLLVSQFTLAAQTNSGLRPSFSGVADKNRAKFLYYYLLEQAQKLHPKVASGEFAAEMQVALVNDGPVTFLLKH
jgi:D-aminoacyl-tRNA deacylase